MTDNEKRSMLEKILGLYFHVEHGLGVGDVEIYLDNPNFPDRKQDFKRDLALAILGNQISPRQFEKLTAEEFETQDEVNEFLTKEIWKPLYGDEPIKT